MVNYLSIYNSISDAFVINITSAVTSIDNQLNIRKPQIQDDGLNFHLQLSFV